MICYSLLMFFRVWINKLIIIRDGQEIMDSISILSNQFKEDQAIVSLVDEFGVMDWTNIS